jgi:2-hydroxy-3-oxopropionate reductase
MNPPRLDLPRVGFIGTGLMGTPMVLNILKSGYSVCVWNRTQAKADVVLSEGATWCDDAASLAKSVDVVVLMLTDATAVSEVLLVLGVADTLSEGTLVIDMSSIAPSVARTHARLLQARGIDHLDAPVSGGTKGAASGSLAIMAGGTPDAFAKAVPLLSVLGRPTHVGAAGAGQVAKLANQIMVAINIEAVAEALAFAKKAGADPRAVRTALIGGFADSRVLQEHGSRMLERNFVPGGTVKNQIKDLDAALAMARESNIELPLLEQTRERFDKLASAGGAALDHSAIIRLFDES